MNKFASVVFTLAATSALVAQEHSAVKWYDDFDVAAAAAKKANKDLLVDFTGSDWCGWCIRLHKEVFDHEEFQTGVEQNFVLVALDFPRSKEAKAKVPNPERNKELQAKYGVRGFPTILLMSPDGDVFGKTGYQKGGPVKYVESLNKMRTEGKENLAAMNALVAKFHNAEGQARVAALALAIDKLGTLKGDEIGIGKLAEVVKTAVDSPDAAVQERVVKALLKTGQADEACMAKAAALDPKNEKGLYEIVVKSKMSGVKDDAGAKAFLAALDGLAVLKVHDAEMFESMLFNAARWSSGPLKDQERAVGYAKLLKEKAKDAAKYKKLLDQILGEGN